MLSRLARPAIRARLILAAPHRRSVYPQQGVFQSPPPGQPVPYSGRVPVEQPSVSKSGASPRSWTSSLAWSFAFGLSVYLVYNGLNGMKRRDSLRGQHNPEELARKWKEFDELDFVQRIRSQGWKEYAPYSGLDQSTKKNRLTTGPLDGSEGLAAQKIIVEPEGQSLLVFINFGASTCGWPGIVHGGVISTVFDEALGRLAIKNTEAKTAVTANLTVSFHSPVKTGEWYYMFVTLLPDSTERKKYVEAQLRGCTEAEIVSPSCCATASALFVVPKKIALKAIPEDF